MNEKMDIVILSLVLVYLRIYTKWPRHCAKYDQLIPSPNSFMRHLRFCSQQYFNVNSTNERHWFKI